MSDFTLQIGGDNRQFVRSLNESERAANSSLTSVGRSIQKQTEGGRLLVSSIRSSIAAATGAVAVVGLITGAIGGVLKRIDDWENRNKRIQEQMDKIRESVDGTVGSMRDIAAIELRFDTSGDIAGVMRTAREAVEEITRESGRDRGREQIERVVAARDEAIQRIRAREFRDGAALVRQEEERLAIQEATLAGDEERVAALQRQFEHQKRINELFDALQGAQQAAQSDPRMVAVAEELSDAIERTIEQYHEAERIEKKRLKNARELVDLEAERSSAAAREQSETSVMFLSRQLQEQQLREQGLDDEAERLRIETDRLRTLEQINRMEELSSDLRETLIRQAEDLAIARLAGVGVGTDDPFQQAGPTGQRFGASVMGNVGLTAATQVLGGGQRDNLEKRQADSLKSLETDVRSLIPVIRDISQQRQTAVFN